MAKTLFPEAHWVGYRYELFKDDTSPRQRKFRRDAIAAYEALSGEDLEAAKKGREYALEERKRLIALELGEQRESVVSLLKEGYSAGSAAQMARVSYGVASKIRDELISAGELPALDSGAWANLARKYGRALAQKGAEK